MMAGKNLLEARKNLEPGRLYSIKEAIALCQTCSKEKFPAALDIAVQTGLDPRKADQNLRMMVSLPHGIGRSEKILVFAQDALAEEAKAAGADFVGGVELIDEVKKGFLGFQKCLATPDMMAAVGVLGRVLGPKGLMPNPRVGTVTSDIGQAVALARKGQVQLRLDKAGIVHACVGRIGFSVEALHENISAVISSIVRSRPSSLKGELLRGIFLASTMGPGVPVDVSEARKEIV